MAAKGLGARMKKLTIPDVDPDKPYPMTKPKLGKAVIVNNVHSEQPGSRADVEALKETYERIGLEVEVHNDCEKTEMTRIKRKIIANEMHKDSNCFVLSVICHGNENGHLLDGHLLDRKKRKAWVTEDILSDLSVVEALVGKPKILVLQSCRGSESTPGISYLGDDGDMDPVTLPDKSDMFVAYATVPGYRAHAGNEGGSAFIQGFSAYLERHFETHDLDAIYSMVNQYMAGVEQGESADKQVSEKRSSLRFPLRFSEFQGKSQGIPVGKPVVASRSARKQKLGYSSPLALPRVQQSQSVTQLNVRLLITYDTGLVYWSRTRFTVMENGHMVLWEKTSEDTSAALHVFLQGSKGFKKVREVKGFCEHEVDIYLEPVKVKYQEFLAVSCNDCSKIILYDKNSEEVTTAFHDPQYYLSMISAGEEGVMYVVHMVKGLPVLKLNTEQIPFTGPHETVQSWMERLYSMVHIPAPHNLLVFSDILSATIRAMSSITGEEKWELRGEVGGRKCTPQGMFFSQDHQLLLVADGNNSRILVLDPRDGSVIKTIQFDREMGTIADLCIQKQKLIVRHNIYPRKTKVSFFSTF